MSILSDDLAAIFADTSIMVPVVYGATSTNGDLSSQDVPEEDGMGGVTIVSRRVVTVQEAVLTGLVNDASITVNGATYRIHGVRSGGRGKTKIILA